jgi:hypothetical protein
MSEGKMIFKKMNEVMKEVGSVGKDQFNKMQGFKFRGIDQFINASDLEKRRSIFKTFNFYIPFLQLFRLSKNHKSYS